MATTTKKNTTTKKVVTPYDAALANAKAGLFNPNQLRTISGSQVDAQIAASLGGVNAASTIEQQQYTDLAERAAGIAKALGNFGPAYGENVRNVYNQAAQTISSLGSGLTGQAAQEWRQEQATNQAQVGSALGGLGSVQSYDPGALRSALQYTGVTIPGAGLANQALTAKSMAEYGAMADQAQVARISQDAISEARKALDKRAAERSAIVAKRPELFQAALQAQREDNARTQTHVDNLITSAQTWLQNQQTLKLKKTELNEAKKQAAIDNQIKERALTHINPKTGQPEGGWVRLKDGTVVPWSTWKSAQQGDKRLSQGNRSLSIQEKHYTDMFNAAQRANNLKAQAASAPGGFDKDMSAALGYVSDDLGHPIVTKGGKPVAYKLPGKKPTAMKIEDKLKIQGSMAEYADLLKAGATDPETGAVVQKPLTIQEAIAKFAARGYFGSKVTLPWAANALALAYGIKPQQVMGHFAGYDPNTGGKYGYDADQPPTPAGVQAANEAEATKGTSRDPRFAEGKPWDMRLDPLQSYVGGAGSVIGKTKSGRLINVATKKYI